MPGHEEECFRDFKKFDNMSTETLEDILRQDLQSSNDNDSDMDTILYIMEVIASRRQSENDENFVDIESAWNSFTQNYLYEGIDNSHEKDTSRTVPVTAQGMQHIPKFRALLVAAITISIFFTFSLAAYAFGFDLWDVVAQWTKDTFSFSSTTEGKDLQRPKHQYEYTSLESALSTYGITTPLSPTSLPGDYLLSSIEISESPLVVTFFALYSNGDDEFMINIIHHLDEVANTLEKDDSTVEIYLAGNIPHYIMRNNALVNVAWINDSFECSIIGTISETTLHTMIDSIYER